MNSTQSNKVRRASVSFAAIDPYIEQNIVLPVEKTNAKKEIVEWGTGNKYPDYLLALYNSVPTLRSIINGNIDFVVGDDVTILPILAGVREGCVNKRGDHVRAQVRDLAKDYEIYGGFALQVIRALDGSIAEIYHVDMRFLRSNKNGDVFYYCEDWEKSGHKKVVVYPAFMPSLDWASLDDAGRAAHASSIVYVKNVNTQVYPAPLYAAAVKACEIERCIDDYHLNAINNGFVSSMIINFNNGVPTDEQKEEIEQAFNEKFSGHQNAGRIMFSWNNSKETATEIVEPKVEDFGDRYNALSDHSRQQIFTSFRATPALFGIVDKTGFNSEEYEQAFKLYNRTQIQPVQRTIIDAYDRIFGGGGAVSIVPFSMGGETEKTVE